MIFMRPEIVSILFTAVSPDIFSSAWKVVAAQ